MSIDNADFEACRQLPTYRAGIWLYRLAIVWVVAPLPFRIAGVRLATPPVAAALALVGVALVLGGGFLVGRSGPRRESPRGGMLRLRPPAGMVARDVFRLTYR